MLAPHTRYKGSFLNDAKQGMQGMQLRSCNYCMSLTKDAPFVSCLNILGLHVHSEMLLRIPITSLAAMHHALLSKRRYFMAFAIDC